MNTSQNQFSIGIDGNYQMIEMPKGMLNTPGWQRREGACLLRGR